MRHEYQMADNDSEDGAEEDYCGGSIKHLFKKKACAGYLSYPSAK